MSSVAAGASKVVVVVVVVVVVTPRGRERQGRVIGAVTGKDRDGF